LFWLQVSRCQFHQHSTYKFFIRTSFWQLFLRTYNWKEAAEMIFVRNNVDEIVTSQLKKVENIGNISSLLYTTLKSPSIKNYVYFLKTFNSFWEIDLSSLCLHVASALLNHLLLPLRRTSTVATYSNKCIKASFWKFINS